MTFDGGARSLGQHRRCKRQIARQSGPGSQSGSDSDIDIGGEEEDSRYGSDAEDEAKYLNELVEKFRQMELQVSNLGEAALQMIQTKMDKFKKFYEKSKRNWKEALEVYNAFFSKAYLL